MEPANAFVCAPAAVARATKKAPPTMALFRSLTPSQQLALLTCYNTGISRAAAAVLARATPEPGGDVFYSLVELRLVTRSPPIHGRRLIPTRAGAMLAELGARSIARHNGVHHLVTGTSRHIDPPRVDPPRYGPATVPQRNPRILYMHFARCSCGWEFSLSVDFSEVERLVETAGRDHVAARASQNGGDHADHT